MKNLKKLKNMATTTVVQTTVCGTQGEYDALKAIAEDRTEEGGVLHGQYEASFNDGTKTITLTRIDSGIDYLG